MTIPIGTFTATTATAPKVSASQTTPTPATAPTTQERHEDCRPSWSALRQLFSAVQYRASGKQVLLALLAVLLVAQLALGFGFQAVALNAIGFGWLALLLRFFLVDLLGQRRQRGR